MNSAALPDNILQRMRPEDRRSLGKAGRTSDEASAAFIAKSERDLQKLIANFLRNRGVWFDQDATHRKRTGTIGTPDFIFCYASRFVAWEVKFGKGKLDPAQEKVRDHILSHGGLWQLITSLDQAREHLNSIR